MFFFIDAIQTHIHIILSILNHLTLHVVFCVLFWYFKQTKKISFLRYLDWFIVFHLEPFIYLLCVCVYFFSLILNVFHRQCSMLSLKIEISILFLMLFFWAVRLFLFFLSPKKKLKFIFSKSISMNRSNSLQFFSFRICFCLFFFHSSIAGLLNGFVE